METREQDGLNKRLSRIDRWLRRCAVACRCGSWNSALMEIECMEAEARGVREELWDIAAREAEGRIRRPLRVRFFAAARTIGLALVMVMLIGFPLSVDQDAPAGGFGAGGNSVAVLTSTEGDILEALRASLSDRNADRVVLTFDRARDEDAEDPPRGAASATAQPAGKGGLRPRGAQNAKGVKPENQGEPSAAVTPAKTSAGREEPEEPSVEEVISLIQVGQRALRVSEPAVKIVP